MPHFTTTPDHIEMRQGHTSMTCPSSLVVGVAYDGNEAYDDHVTVRSTAQSGGLLS